MPAGTLNYITENIAKVRQRLSQAAKICGRNPAEITLLAVSKSRSVAELEHAYDCGLTDFGENYLQEAEHKMKFLQHLPIRWHFIGNIQSNKTTLMAERFAWLHGVDRVRIAKRLSAACDGKSQLLNICLQVNVDREPSKAGFSPEQVLAAAAEIARLPGLRLRGLMAIPMASDLAEIQQQSFAKMHRLFEQLQRQLPDADTLSMGMSDDLEAAIAEGATIVRIGTAIFGPRSARSAE